MHRSLVFGSHCTSLQLHKDIWFRVFVTYKCVHVYLWHTFNQYSRKAHVSIFVNELTNLTCTTVYDCVRTNVQNYGNPNVCLSEKRASTTYMCIVWFQLHVHCVLFGFSYTYISTLIASTTYIVYCLISATRIYLL